MKQQRIISEEELRYIDDFCKKRDIQYLDLRLELVDHIAERVSELLTNKPELSFSEAFNLVYKSFGIYGLTDIAAEHQNIMMTNYWTKVWQLFKPWFSPPRIVITLLFSYGLYELFSSIGSWLNYVSILPIVLFVTSIVYSIISVKKVKRSLNGEKTMLMGGVITNLFWGGYILFMGPIPFYNWIGWTSESSNIPPALFVTIIFVLTLLFVNANIKIVKMIKSEVEVLSSRVAC